MPLLQDRRIPTGRRRKEDREYLASLRKEIRVKKMTIQRLELDAMLVASQKLKLEVATRDTARIDWMEAQWQEGLHVERYAANTGLTVHGLHPESAVYVGPEEFRAVSIREATDKAMEVK